MDMQYFILDYKLDRDTRKLNKFINKSVKENKKINGLKLDFYWVNGSHIYDEVDKLMERFKKTDLSEDQLDSIEDRIEMTDKLVTYALCYLASKDKKKLPLTSDQCQLVNAIAAELQQPKIYESEQVANLDYYNIDNKNFMRNPRFVLSINNFNKLFNTKTFRELLDNKKSNNVISEKKTETPVATTDTIVEAPKPEGTWPIKITFSAPNEHNSINVNGDPVVVDVEPEELKPIVEQEAPKEEPKMAEEIKESLKYLKPILDGSNVIYRFGLNPDKSVTLYITRPGEQEIQYLIDTGSVFGSGNYCILVNVPGYDNNIRNEIVSLKETELIRTILINPYNTPSYAEIMEAQNKYCFSNTGIHQMFDMSSINIDLLSDEEKASFEDKLDKIYNYIAISAYQNGVQYPRFRVATFDSANKFTIESDVNVKTYLAPFNGHFDHIALGTRGAVNGDILTIESGSTINNVILQ